MRILDIAELLLLAALWGGSFLFMRIAAPVLSPHWLNQSLNCHLSDSPICDTLGRDYTQRSCNGVNDIRLWFGFIGNCDRFAERLLGVYRK